MGSLLKSVGCYLLIFCFIGSVKAYYYYRSYGYRSYSYGYRSYSYYYRSYSYSGYIAPSPSPSPTPAPPPGAYIPKMCPAGWSEFDGHCYYKAKVSAITFSEAQDVCSNLGGSYVVSINSENEEKFVADQISSNEYWLGWHNNGSGWRWEDGETTAIKTPSGSGGQCASVKEENVGWWWWGGASMSTITWSNSFCSSSNRVLCEINVNDTLTVCGEGWIWWGANCYMIGTNFTTYPQARSECESINGTLASVLDSDENNAIQEFTVGSGQTKSWIGLHRETTNGPWKWEDGTEVVYTKWRGWEPDWWDRHVLAYSYVSYSWWGAYSSFSWIAEPAAYTAKHMYICKKSVLDRAAFPVAQESVPQNDREGAYFKAETRTTVSLQGSGALTFRSRIDCARYCATSEQCDSFYYDRTTRKCALSDDSNIPLDYKLKDPLP